MSYELRYHSAVMKDDVPALDTSLRTRVRSAIEQKLATKPDLFGIPLRRSLKGLRKLRVGDYRIIFRIEKKHVLVFAIQHRSVVYTNVEHRIH